MSEPIPVTKRSMAELSGSSRKPIGRSSEPTEIQSIARWPSQRLDSGSPRKARKPARVTTNDAVGMRHAIQATSAFGGPSFLCACVRERNPFSIAPKSGKSGIHIK